MGGKEGQSFANKEGHSVCVLQLAANNQTATNGINCTAVAPSHETYNTAKFKPPANPTNTHLDGHSNAHDGLGGHALARPCRLPQERFHPLGLTPAAAGSARSSS
jgi:hypothetical protein